jgi:hypothetical protein
MGPPRAEPSYASHQPARLTSHAAEPPLAERLTRALDADDVVTVVGLLSLTGARSIAALPPLLLERLRASTSREITAACDAKRAPTATRPVSRFARGTASPSAATVSDLAPPASELASRRTW